MKYVFHPEAEAEFLAAIDYYEGCEPGLGYDFSVEVHSTIGRILSFPDAWPVLEDDIRRCLPKKGPLVGEGATHPRVQTHNHGPDGVWGVVSAGGAVSGALTWSRTAFASSSLPRPRSAPAFTLSASTD